MAKSYVHELGDRLSNGSTADNLPSHIKEIAPVMYNDGSNNFNSIQGALNGKAASTHSHGNITSDGKVGTAANKPLITTTGGAVTAGSFGTTANTFCQGNDSRLSDARTPTSHTHGSITNDGKIGSTANLSVVTGTSGAVTAEDLTVASPSVPSSGTTTSAEFIDSVSQASNGKITATKKTVRPGTTSQTGIVQLSDATDSTSTSLAATANAVKTAYDLAASKQGAVSTDTDSSDFGDATTIATGFGSDKIHLNVASRLWNYIKGKLGISSSGSSTKFLNEQGEFVTVTSPDVSGKADKVTGATAGDVATLDAKGNLVDSGMTLGKSVPANAVFTDTKVTQTKNNSSTIEYPLLMAGTTDPNGTATSTRYDEDVKLNPSTNTISANISGNAATATTATSADTATTATTAASADIATSTSSGKILANKNLNDYNTDNRNYLCNATDASTVSNRPSGASGAFELEVIRGTGYTCVQIYYSRDDANSNYIRKYTGTGAWTNWAKLIDSSDDVMPTYFAFVTQSAFDDVKAAYIAGKRIVGVLGGTTSAGNPFRQETPLAFVAFTDSEPTAFTFLFENAKPKTAAGAGLGSTTRWTVSSSGWASSTDNIDYAETAGTLSSVLPTSKGGTGFSTVDTAPTKDSNKMVTSSGVWNDTPSPIAHYFDATGGIVGIYGTTNRADEVVIRNCGRFRLSTSWLKNFSGRTFKIHNATAAEMEISVQVEVGLKLVLTDELKTVRTLDNTSGSKSDETRNVLSLLAGETLRMYVIHTSGSTEVAVFLIGSGRWSLFQPAYDKYRRTTGIKYYQTLCYDMTTGNPGRKGNVHLYDGTNWHNLCNLTSSSGIVRIAGLKSSRDSSSDTYDWNMDIITGLTIARHGYMGMLYGYVVPNYSTAARLPKPWNSSTTNYVQSGKTMANCSQLKIDGFADDAVGSGHAVYTGSKLLHVVLLSGTLTFSINGDFSVFTQGAQYFFSIPLSFGSLTA